MCAVNKCQRSARQDFIMNWVHQQKTWQILLPQKTVHQQSI